jgi:hypothetical protein
MIYLVFDIETAAMPFEKLTGSQQEYLLRGAKSDEEREERKRMMSLNPLTARVASIGMVYATALDAEPKGCIYSGYGDPEDGERHSGDLPDGSVWHLMPEAEMLTRWWEILSKGKANGGYHLISFNGRGFDCPFLMLRSAALRVRPTRNLMNGTRWNYDRHTDLQEELVFRQNDRNGAMRRFNFDFYCQSFGIKSPKAEGVTGYDVPELYRQGEHRKIAEYCMRDVRATWDLYRFWREFLGPDVEG